MPPRTARACPSRKSNPSSPNLSKPGKPPNWSLTSSNTACPSWRRNTGPTASSSAASPISRPLTDADPHREGLPVPKVQPVQPKSVKARKAAKLVADFFKSALPVLAQKHPANGFLLRGIAHQPAIPAFSDRYGLRAACIAVYPMYKGLAQLVGMAKLEGPQTIAEQFERYLAEYDNYNYFFIHYKYTDMCGEDGNFAAKTNTIAEFDAALPLLLRKKPDVLAITGDHSTPCILKGHSWHPQPVLLHSPYSGSDTLERFTETGANTGSLGVFEAKHLIRLMQANARMFDKFGA